jgi:hypothetical protein
MLRIMTVGSGMPKRGLLAEVTKQELFEPVKGNAFKWWSMPGAKTLVGPLR